MAFTRWAISFVLIYAFVQMKNHMRLLFKTRNLILNAIIYDNRYFNPF